MGRCGGVPTDLTDSCIVASDGWPTVGWRLLEQGPRDSLLRKLIGWRVVHSGASGLVAAILILVRAEGNQHLHLWLRKTETDKLGNRPKTGSLVR